MTYIRTPRLKEARAMHLFSEYQTQIPKDKITDMWKVINARKTQRWHLNRWKVSNLQVAQ